MKFFLSIIAIASFIFTSCKNNSVTTTTAEERDSVKNEPYYPVSEYIRGQVQYVDSIPFAIQKLVFINGNKVDSTTIDRPAFEIMAKEFEQPDLNLNEVKPMYKETIYNDLSMNAITFTYDAEDPDQELQQATVLLNPETKNVKNIIFKKIRVSGDTMIMVNGLWKNNLNFQLNYILQPKGKAVIEKQVKVSWDKPL